MVQKKTIEILDSLQLLGFIQANGTACRFVGITYKAPLERGKGIKAAHPFGEVFKVSKFQGLVNANFCESVKNRMAAILGVDSKQVSYETGKSSYVHPDGQPPCIVVKATNPDDGVFYLQYQPAVEKTESVYVNGAGEIISKEDIQKWLPARNPGPAWKPPIVALMLSRIVELRASGKILSAEDADEAKALLALQDSTIEVPLNDPAPALVPA